MENSQEKDNNRSTHSQYTEAYVGILNTYKEQLGESIKNKNKLKLKFFNSIKCIMYVTAFSFGIVIVLSLVVMGIMAYSKNDSVEILAGSIVTIISSFVTMILTIFKLPQIIAQYLFNKEEDKQMKEIIVNIQRYELDADKAERMREQANIDAVANSILYPNESDLEMNNSRYVDPSDVQNGNEELEEA